MKFKSFSMRTAQASDVDQVTACVMAAYQHYIERIGQLPGPMRDDYAEIIDHHSVWVVEQDNQVVGLLVLIDKGAEARVEQGLLLDNIAVHPDYQRQGVGRWLMAYAEREARHRGFRTIYLYTHEKMTENITLYQKLGYIELERRTERGLARVYMSKRL